MTRRPMLILNGKPKRYGYLRVVLSDVLAGVDFGPYVEIDLIVPFRGYRSVKYREEVKVSLSTRPSGRRMIYVDVPEVE